MKKILRKLILPALIFAGMFGTLVTAPAFAEPGDGTTAETTATSGDKKCVQTALFGEYCDDGSGSGIFFILNIVLTVLTFGVGIAGTIGIVIAGIQYASAKDNEQQVAKAKMRIFQIVIGMVIWAVLYVALKWLIPGFGSNSGS